MPRHVPTSAKPIRFSKFFFKRGSGLGNRSSSTMDRPWVCQISTQENTVPQMPHMPQVHQDASSTSWKSFGRFQSLAVLPTKTHGWTLHKVPWSIQASATALLESIVPFIGQAHIGSTKTGSETTAASWLSKEMRHGSPPSPGVKHARWIEPNRTNPTTRYNTLHVLTHADTWTSFFKSHAHDDVAQSNFHLQGIPLRWRQPPLFELRQIAAEVCGWPRSEFIPIQH